MSPARLDAIRALVECELREYHGTTQDIGVQFPEHGMPVEDDLPQFSPDWKFYMAFLGISMLTLAAAIDATSLSIALPVMTKELGGSSIEAFWAGTSFLVTSAVVMPIYAAISHIFGRKPLVHVSSLLFAGGTIMSALAPTMMIMLGGRVLQGLGAGGSVVLGEIIITDLVPLHARPKWLGWLGSMWTIGGLIGPLTGGLFAELVSWRWVFWVLLPFIIGGSIISEFFLRQEPVAGLWLLKFGRVDWFGALLFLAGTVAFLVPLTCGGIIVPWSDWKILVPMFLGVDMLFAFMFWEKKYAREPMIRFQIFHNWTLKSTYIQTVLHALIFWAAFYYLPLYYQVVKEYSIIISGVAMLPETLVVSPMTIIIGILISGPRGQYRWAVYGGWFFTCLGAGLLILLDVHTSIAVFVIINVVACLGIGTLIVAMNFAVQAAVHSKHVGHAVAFYVFLRQFGEGLGVAVGGVVFQNSFKTNLYAMPEWHNKADWYSKEPVTFIEVLKGLKPGPGRDDLKQAYADALKIVWMAMTGTAFIGLCLTLLVKSYSMDTVHETEQGWSSDDRSPRPVQQLGGV